MSRGGRHSATLCVVCGDRCPHKSSEVVGRKPNGIPRLLCGKSSCRRTWADPVKRSALMAKWVENREGWGR